MDHLLGRTPGAMSRLPIDTPNDWVSLWAVLHTPAENILHGLQEPRWTI